MALNHPLFNQFKYYYLPPWPGLAFWSWQCMPSCKLYPFSRLYTALYCLCRALTLENQIVQAGTTAKTRDSRGNRLSGFPDIPGSTDDRRDFFFFLLLFCWSSLWSDYDMGPISWLYVTGAAKTGVCRRKSKSKSSAFGWKGCAICYYLPHVWPLRDTAFSQVFDHVHLHHFAMNEDSLRKGSPLQYFSSRNKHSCQMVMATSM